MADGGKIKKVELIGYSIAVAAILFAVGCKHVDEGTVVCTYVEKPEAKLPLKKSLDLLDEKSLEPFEVVDKHKFTDEDMLADRISWRLANKEDDVEDMRLFLSYHYGLKEQLVGEYIHVSYIDSHEWLDLFHTDIDVSCDNNVNLKVPVFISLAKFNSKDKTVYTASINSYCYKGKYASNFPGLNKMIDADVDRKQGYRCDFSLNFDSDKEIGKQKAIEVATKVLDGLVPELESEHWPEI